MKKYLVALFLLFLFPGNVSAQNVITGDKSVEVRVRNVVNSNQPVNQEIRQKIETKREEVRVRISAVRRERIRNFFAKAVTRVEALIERLNNLISRIESRIQKIGDTDPDLDVSTAQQDLTKAKGLIADAQEKLTQAKNEFEDTLGSENPRDQFKNVVFLFNDIKRNLRQVHTLLVHTIGEIKGLRVGNNNHNNNE